MNDTATTQVTAEGITITRMLPASPSAVWAACTQPAQFAKWFGEPGSWIPVETASMDVRTGGRWSVVMHVPNPEDSNGPAWELPFAGDYVEVDEPHRLVMSLTEPSDPSAPKSGNAELLTFVFTDAGDGRTHMLFTQTGGNLPEEEYVRAAAGENIFFDRLTALLAAG